MRKCTGVWGAEPRKHSGGRAPKEVRGQRPHNDHYLAGSARPSDLSHRACSSVAPDNRKDRKVKVQCTYTTTRVQH